MKYLFYQTDRSPTHIRADGVVGVLESFPDSTQISGPSEVLTSDEGYQAIPQPEPEPPTQEECIALGEQHVQNAGLTGARLVTLMDLLLQTKEANALASKPKLVALYTWLQTVKGMAIAGSVSFPPAPHTFEEVVSE
jgi:hypothetical protein